MRCILVSDCDPSKYVAAEWRDKNRQALIAAERKCAANLRFCISKVSMSSRTKQEYLHCPVRQVIALNKCHMDPLLQTGTGSVQPQPSMSLKDVEKLTQSCRFDVTALVHSIGNPRAVTTSRKVMTVQLLDASGPDGKVQIVALSFFYSEPLEENERETMQFLNASVGKGAYSFFALQGKQKETGYNIESSKDCFVLPAVGARAEELVAREQELQGKAQTDDAVVLQIAPPPQRRDWHAEQGKESFAKILAGLGTTTNLEAMEEQSVSVWQLNWVEVSWPEEERITTKNGERLWFSTVIRDISGSMAGAWMNEESALALARLESKDDFIQSHKDGKKLFPVVASIKLTRAMQKSEEDGGTDGAHLGTQDGHRGSQDGQRFNFTIVHAADQAFTEAPTQETLELLPLLDNLKTDTSGLLPAALQMVETSPHYTFEVAPTGCTSMPCQKIISLIRCSKNSKVEQLGAGFKLTTTGVADLLASDKGDTSPKRYTVSAVCTLENLPNYRLDPPRGGEQHALVTISDKIGDTFVLDQVQLLKPEEATVAAVALRKMLTVAIELHKPSRKRGGAWTEEFSPAMSKKCKVLGRSPTSDGVQPCST